MKYEIFFDESHQLDKMDSKYCYYGILGYKEKNISELNKLFKERNIGYELHFSQFKLNKIEDYTAIFKYALNNAKTNIFMVNCHDALSLAEKIDINIENLRRLFYIKIPERLIYGMTRKLKGVKNINITIDRSDAYGNDNLQLVNEECEEKLITALEDKKINIIKSILNKKSTKIESKLKKIRKLLENKSFTKYEIEEKIKLISENYDTSEIASVIEANKDNLEQAIDKIQIILEMNLGELDNKINKIKSSLNYDNCEEIRQLIINYIENNRKRIILEDFLIHIKKKQIKILLTNNLDSNDLNKTVDNLINIFYDDPTNINGKVIEVKNIIENKYKHIQLVKVLKDQLNSHSVYRNLNYKIEKIQQKDSKESVGLQSIDILLGVISYIFEEKYYEMPYEFSKFILSKKLSEHNITEEEMKIIYDNYSLKKEVYVINKGSDNDIRVQNQLKKINRKLQMFSSKNIEKAEFIYMLLRDNRILDRLYESEIFIWTLRNKDIENSTIKMRISENISKFFNFKVSYDENNIRRIIKHHMRKGNDSDDINKQDYASCIDLNYSNTKSLIDRYLDIIEN